MSNPVARGSSYVLHAHSDGEPGYHVWVWCPGCETLHSFTTKQAQGGPAQRPTWGWDGNLESPTFTPSYLTWTGDRNNPTSRCHSFLTAGVWNFLTDSTHALAGKHVPMVPLPDWLMA